MKKYNPILNPQKITKIVCYLFILLFLVTLFYTCIYQLLENTPEANLEKNNTAIQLISLISGIITIVFLFINYKQLNQQNEVNKQDVEFNRALDATYKQIDFTVNFIKNDEVLSQINRTLFSDGIEHMNFYYTYEPVLTDKLNSVHEFLNVIKFIIHSHNIGIDKKNYLLKTAYYNIGSSFFLNLSLLKIFDKKNENEEASNLYIFITSIERFNTIITEENEQEKIDVSRLYLEGE